MAIATKTVGIAEIRSSMGQDSMAARLSVLAYSGVEAETGMIWKRKDVVADFGHIYQLWGAEEGMCEEFFSKSGLILDLGCGAGRTTLPLYERGYRVIGADLSEPMVRLMRRRFPYLPAVRADASALPFPDACFQGVLFSYNGSSMIVPAELRKRAFEEVFRVLKPNGYFVMSAHNVPGIVFNLRDRSLRTITERLFALRHFRAHGRYVFEKRLGCQVYYCHMDDIRRELESLGFQWCATYDRHGRFGEKFCRWFDPWPYHCFQKVERA
ncbi:class I SAM-dependent methyltransferase [Candidatus Parcubacteria bacterium]|nr:MAG: class I SAM-dependent methyltransferase [Candidatus Parcubacteria bacterium]